ncbi:MAG: cysteine--tRNA ligase [Proteobacteria bacterium]|nr:cysteine--tRNA ligase [Pseudomonadota bacterium]MBS0573668.1 cysteine--tRNA ligase [Pseudomonadota bacterium]
MTTIRLRNTRTRKVEPFAPIDPKNVRMYVCGPTVYDRAHLGNARPVIVFDVLYRLLRHLYGAEHVTYVRNFTDVDDKINAEAQRRKGLGDPRSLEELIRERTEETIGWYHADMDALGALRPDKEPRATDFIGQMIGMIEGLMKPRKDGKPFAYERDGHVLFRVREYVDYGKLSGRSVDDMIAGARVEVAPFKEDPMDFVLWKPSDADLPGWDSPWGRGRPGWHIECSAMSHELLGESFDIHGGGIDLQFPHHENEIAQSMCAHPEGGFARVWMHNEMLQVEGKKMSKSLGNFFTVRDILQQRQTFGHTIRYMFLNTHYRKPLDWTEMRLNEARKELSRWAPGARMIADRDLKLRAPHPEIVAAVANDLNTSLALKVASRLATKVLHSAESEDAIEFASAAHFLGFDIEELASKIGFKWDEEVSFDTNDVAVLQKILGFRWEARDRKNFALSDEIRDRLLAAGIALKDKGNREVEHEFAASFNRAVLEETLALLETGALK